MSFLPLRLSPGQDLRSALEAQIAALDSAAFVLSGIGSLVSAELRFANEPCPTTIAGPLEILTLAGSLARNGGHLHLTVADSHGQVFGGHLCHGSIVRTTAEVLLALLPDWQLTREHDPTTGYQELVVEKKAEVS